jgi:hypothetical protein
MGEFVCWEVFYDFLLVDLDGVFLKEVRIN